MGREWQWVAMGGVGLVLTVQWLPLGPAEGLLLNALFLLLVIGGLLFLLLTGKELRE